MFQNNKIVELELRIRKDLVKHARVVYSSINLVVLKLHANIKLELHRYNIIFPNVNVLYFVVKNKKDWDFLQASHPLFFFRAMSTRLTLAIGEESMAFQTLE